MSTGLFQDEEESYNIEETKYVLKGSAPSTDSSFDAGAESLDAPEEEDIDGLDAFDDAPIDDGNSDKPFDDEPFDAGVEADEDTDPVKYIQQLSGKLGQSLRQYTEDEGQPDFDLEKFAVNSVLSATHTGEMDKGDQRDIINKVKGSGNDEGSGEEEISADIEEPTSGGEEELDFSEEEPVEEIVEELPLSGDDLPININSPEMSGMITGCQVEQQPIDAKAVDILKDMTESENDTMLSNLKNMKSDMLKESEKSSNFVDKAKLIEKLRLMENIETAPIIEPITKPDVKPARPMRETDRPFLPKRKDKVNPKPKANVSEGGLSTVEFDGKQVDISSLKIEGVDRRDYPDFVDAFFTYGEYSDGMEMSDIELQKFTDINGELLNELIFERQLYM
jgi:hypothetical protein